MIRRRPKEKSKSPWLVIVLNIAILAFLVFVGKDLILRAGQQKTPAATPVGPLVRFNGSWAEIAGTPMRIPVVRPENTIRFLFVGVGPWSRNDAAPNEDPLDAIFTHLSTLLPDRTVETFRIEPPDATLADLSDLLDACAKLSPSLIVVSPTVKKGLAPVAQEKQMPSDSAAPVALQRLGDGAPEERVTANLRRLVISGFKVAVVCANRVTDGLALILIPSIDGVTYLDIDALAQKNNAARLRELAERLAGIIPSEGQ